MDSQELLRENEADANKKAALAMLFTLGLYTIVFILNLLGIFIIQQFAMNISYIVTSISLLLPMLLNRIFGADKPFLKYIYIGLSAIFIFVSTCMMTYHLPVIYIYPVALAGVYFSKRVTRYSIILTIIGTIAGQIVGFYGNFLNDANFHNIYEQIIFRILPNTMCLLAISSMLKSLTKRTSHLLQTQKEKNDENINLSNDMISGFATLVENRDENTGLHIQRTSSYVELLCHHLQTKEKYKDILTNEFMDNLIKAAPMHDVGKISVPDAILQKPGPLTTDEFNIMKEHAAKGGRIIMQTFGHVGSEAYRKTAYEVARYHHEKWDGSGYPEGLSGENIPLSARIMTVADVFDAISQNRCYRKAIPLDECFEIMEKGSAVEFEPELVESFIELRPEVEKICNEFRDM